MQPIIVLGVAAVAVALVGTGFLGEPWNEFELWVQQLGWGEADVDSPISHATVDLNIKKTRNCGPDKECNTMDDFFENRISHCSFHSDDSIPPAMGKTQVSPGVLICKLTDDRDLAIAEGKLNFDEYTGSETLLIEITQLAYPEANDVQAPIHDVKLIVEAPI